MSEETGFDEDDDIKIENVVASTTLDRRMPLDRIAIYLENTEYEPEQFPGLVYRIDEPKVVFLLFSSGRIVCTGGRTYDDVRNGIEKLKENLKEIGAL